MPHHALGWSDGLGVKLLILDRNRMQSQRVVDHWHQVACKYTGIMINSPHHVEMNKTTRQLDARAEEDLGYCQAGSETSSCLTS